MFFANTPPLASFLGTAWNRFIAVRLFVCFRNFILDLHTNGLTCGKHISLFSVHMKALSEMQVKIYLHIIGVRAVRPGLGNADPTAIRGDY